MRIAQAFTDDDKEAKGDKIHIAHINLKNRQYKQSEEEKDWYDKAFGSRQNMMQFRYYFRPDDKQRKGKLDYYFDFQYKMFPELEGEFNRSDWVSKKFKMEEKELANGEEMFEIEFEYPYGTFSFEIKHCVKGKEESEIVDDDLIKITEKQEEYMVGSVEPDNPISMEELRKIHAEEEEENKQREQEARLAQKRLEEEKARLRYEQ